MWTLAGGVLECVDRDAPAPGVVLVPSERVLSLVVDLPLSNRAQKLAALPFAVEDSVAEPLEEVHVALGAEVAPGRHLAGVVRHEIMRDWLALIAASGLPRAAMTPDYLALPRPAEGGWSVGLAAGRALVRTAEGSGFAVPADLLEPAWSAAGRPAVVSYGEPPPDGMTAGEPGLELSAAAARSVLPPLLDLRQGLYAARGRPEVKLLRRLAAVVAVAAVAHTGILAVDALALRRMADNRRVEVETLVRQTAPGLPVTGDLAATLAPLLAAEDATARSRFFPLFSRTAAALQPIASSLTLQGLSFAADGALTLEVEAPDIAALQRVQTTLAAAGLTAAGGSASTAAGRAAGEIVVREGAPS